MKIMLKTFFCLQILAGKNSGVKNLTLKIPRAKNVRKKNIFLFLKKISDIFLGEEFAKNFF